ncbi:HNH homing endonuclease [Vibrio phage PJN101]|nr:HNH homing endonuclease [Vibrio phage PJN101]
MELDNYTYLPVVGFEGRYSITKCGKAWSHLRNKWLTTRPNTKGYLTVDLRDTQGKQHTKKVHRLVAISFIPNPDNLDTVDHVDEDKLNNHADNLQWLSSGDNSAKSKAKEYLMVSPDGVLTRISNMRQFCRDHNLNPGNMNSVFAGRQSHCKGWRLPN